MLETCYLDKRRLRRSERRPQRSGVMNSEVRVDTRSRSGCLERFPLLSLFGTAFYLYFMYTPPIALPDWGLRPTPSEQERGLSGTRRSWYGSCSWFLESLISVFPVLFPPVRLKIAGHERLIPIGGPIGEPLDHSRRQIDAFDDDSILLFSNSTQFFNLDFEILNLWLDFLPWNVKFDSFRSNY